jgi:hypothetical protein
MKAPLSIILFIALCSYAADTFRSDLYLTSDVDGRVFELSVKDADFRHAPVWNPADDHPPLSPKRALELARAELAHVVSDVPAWQLNGIELRPMTPDGHWIFVVEYSKLATDGGFAPYLSFVVLMDGTVIEPKLQKRTK